MLNLLGWTCWVLAQDKQAPPGLGYLPAVFVVIAMYMFLMFRNDRKKQKSHRQALEALKKNDRVVTIGGIHGVVTNVQRETDEVTIKVDEANNTKLRVTLSAIARVVADDSAATDKSTKSST
jgi:preprotein translocase subunit YajC